MYCMTGNGSDKGENGLKGGDWSESVLKLNLTLDKVLSFFTPSDKRNLNTSDSDFGSSGLVLIPGTNFVVGGGKAPILYLMDRGNLGGFNQTRDSVVAFPNVAAGDDPGRSHHIHGAPAYYNGPDWPRLYVWPENSFQKSISFAGNSPTLTVTSVGTLIDPENVPGGRYGMPGRLLSVSSNGTKAGTGVLWANHPYLGDANQAVRSGVLRVFDPYDLTRVLWHSEQNPFRDDFGNFAKFCCPTISGGRVYQATMGGLQSKQTAVDTTNVTPALANQNDKSLAIAFLGAGDEIYVNTSPNGLVWDSMTRFMIPEQHSKLSPGLAFDPSGITYLSCG
jgi:hypothetical protein